MRIKELFEAKTQAIEIMKKADQAVQTAISGGNFKFEPTKFPLTKLDDWMKKSGVSMSEIDAVIKQQTSSKSLSAYIAKGWDAAYAEALAAAREAFDKLKQSGKMQPDFSGSFKVSNKLSFEVKKGKIVPEQNPWK